MVVITVILSSFHLSLACSLHCQHLSITVIFSFSRRFHRMPQYIIITRQTYYSKDASCTTGKQSIVFNMNKSKNLLGVLFRLLGLATALRQIKMSITYFRAYSAVAYGLCSCLRRVCVGWA